MIRRPSSGIPAPTTAAGRHGGFLTQTFRRPRLTFLKCGAPNRAVGKCLCHAKARNSRRTPVRISPRQRRIRRHSTGTSSSRPHPPLATATPCVRFLSRRRSACPHGMRRFVLRGILPGRMEPTCGTARMAFTAFSRSIVHGPPHPLGRDRQPSTRDRSGETKRPGRRRLACQVRATRTARRATMSA